MDYGQLINAVGVDMRAEEEKRQRIERFSQFFNRVNSAFAFRKVTVKVENSAMTAPAWSSASEVTFNSKMLGDLKDAQSIAGIKGLNLHELSHILFTPRTGLILSTGSSRINTGKRLMLWKIHVSSDYSPLDSLPVLNGLLQRS